MAVAVVAVEGAMEEDEEAAEVEADMGAEADTEVEGLMAAPKTRAGRQASTEHCSALFQIFFSFRSIPRTLVPVLRPTCVCDRQDLG